MQGRRSFNASIKRGPAAGPRWAVTTFKRGEGSGFAWETTAVRRICASSLTLYGSALMSLSALTRRAPPSMHSSAIWGHAISLPSLAIKGRLALIRLLHPEILG